MAKILIKNGRIWDGERFFFSDVLTDGELVSEIRENISEPADFVFNAEGKIVSPRACGYACSYERPGVGNIWNGASYEQLSVWRDGGQ